LLVSKPACLPVKLTDCVSVLWVQWEQQLPHPAAACPAVGSALFSGLLSLCWLCLQECCLIMSNSDTAGAIQLEGAEMVMPGENFRASVSLNLPVAMEVGLRFAIRDSGRTVGAGVVTQLLE
jgi:hypothetical protein